MTCRALDDHYCGRTQDSRSEKSLESGLALGPRFALSVGWIEENEVKFLPARFGDSLDCTQRIRLDDAKFGHFGEIELLQSLFQRPSGALRALDKHDLAGPTGIRFESQGTRPGKKIENDASLDVAQR